MGGVVARGVTLKSRRTIPHFLLKYSSGGLIVLGGGLTRAQGRKITDRVPDGEIGALAIRRLWLAEESAVAVADEDDAPTELRNPIVGGAEYVTGHPVVEIFEESLYGRNHSHVTKSEDVLDQKSGRSKSLHDPVKLADEFVPRVLALTLPDGRKTLTWWASYYPIRLILKKTSQAPLGEITDIEVSSSVVLEVVFIRGNCIRPTIDC
jgi:hypothetical protein